MSHADAVMYCDGLVLGGASDSRLPERNELMSIVDVSKYDPAYDTSVFPAPDASVRHFWSSDLTPIFFSRPWFVAFREGGLSFADPTSDAGTRCVRP